MSSSTTEGMIMQVCARISTSLDGFVATPGGWPTVDVDSREYVGHGDEEFAARSGAIVWGRLGFDQGFDGGWETWPWPDKQVYVLTSRPLPERANGLRITAVDGPQALGKRLREDNDTGVFEGDVHVVGGGKAVQNLLRAGVIDRLELLILPILVGAGVPLFEVQPTPYSPRKWAAAADRPAAESLTHPLEQLRLESHRAFDDGVVELVYTPNR